MTLCCPTCGRSHLGRSDTRIVERLQAATEPLTSVELLRGINVAPSSWQATLHRIRAKLGPLGLMVVNVKKPGPGIARYRLQPIEEA